MSKERRHFNRVSFKAPAKFYVNNDELECRVIDLSLHGALIQVDQMASFKADSDYRIDIPLGEAGEHIAINLKLMHQEGDKLGLMCQQIDVDSITHLKKLVELNMGDSELLNREFKELILDNK